MISEILLPTTSIKIIFIKKGRAKLQLEIDAHDKFI